MRWDVLALTVKDLITIWKTIWVWHMASLQRINNFCAVFAPRHFLIGALPIWSIMKEFILMKNPLLAKCVERDSVIFRNFRYMQPLIQGRKSTSVEFAEKGLHRTTIWSPMNLAFTKLFNYLVQTSVENISYGQRKSRNMLSIALITNLKHKLVVNK